MARATETSIDNELRFEVAYREVESEVVALPTQKVRRVNLDVPSAVAMVLGVNLRLVTYRQELIDEFRSFDVVQFDRLEPYAMALSHAHALYLTAGTPPDVPKQLYDEGFRRREMLHTDIKVLIGRGLIPVAALKGYRGLVGYENIASELQIECQVLKDNWSVIGGRCAPNLAEIAHAAKIAEQLLSIARRRDELPELVARVADRRNRHFTLFIDAYTEARDALQYLRRHEGDADAIAPPLYSGRSSSKNGHANKSSTASESSEDQAIPAVPEATAISDAAIATNGPFVR